MGTLSLDNPIARMRVEAIRHRLGLDTPQPVQKPVMPVSPKSSNRASAAPVRAMSVARPPKPEWLAKLHQRSAEIRTVACARWPEVFGKPVPLAVGIRESLAADLAEQGFNIGEIDAFLGYHTCSPWYLAACVEGAARVNLNGEEVGRVTANEAGYAADRLARRQQQVTNKNATGKKPMAQVIQE